jgi:hypothetical protein
MLVVHYIVYYYYYGGGNNPQLGEAIYQGALKCRVVPQRRGFSKR